MARSFEMIGAPGMGVGGVGMISVGAIIGEGNGVGLPGVDVGTGGRGLGVWAGLLGVGVSIGD